MVDILKALRRGDGDGLTVLELAICQRGIDYRRVIHAGDRDGDGGRSLRSIRIDDGVLDCGGACFTFGQIVELTIRIKQNGAILLDGEQPTIATGLLGLLDDFERISVGVRVVVQHIAHFSDLFFGRGVGIVLSHWRWVGDGNGEGLANA